MVFDCIIEKDAKSKYWAILLEDLAVYIQGTSVDDAKEMLQDALELLAESEELDVEAVKIDISEGQEKNNYKVKFVNHKQALPFILNRMRYNSKLSLADLSNKMGKKSRTVVQRYVTGSSEPSVSAFHELMSAMGYEVEIRPKSKAESA